LEIFEDGEFGGRGVSKRVGKEWVAGVNRIYWWLDEIWHSAIRFGSKMAEVAEARQLIHGPEMLLVLTKSYIHAVASRSRGMMKRPSS